MEKANVVGRVSTLGWAVTPEDKLSAAFINYAAAPESSSTLYRGHVRSFAYAVFKCQEDMRELAALVKDDLTELLTDIFPEGVTVETDTIATNDGSAAELTIRCIVTDKGATYNLSNTLKPGLHMGG